MLERSEFDEIRIFSRDEKKQDDMRHELSNPKVKFYIGDVRDRLSVDNAMEGVDFVFHAAALKQVPSCEFFPVEAVKTNVLGTNNVLDSAIINNVTIAIVTILVEIKVIIGVTPDPIMLATSDKIVFPRSAL